VRLSLHLGAGSSLLVKKRVMTDGDQIAESKNELVLAGDNSKANMISRSVIKGDSKQDFYVNLEARAKSFGHMKARRATLSASSCTSDSPTSFEE
jgi:Fe-S cluster assembly scaffold protein SufB